MGTTPASARTPQTTKKAPTSRSRSQKIRANRHPTFRPAMTGATMTATVTAGDASQPPHAAASSVDLIGLPALVPSVSWRREPSLPLGGADADQHDGQTDGWS